MAKPYRVTWFVRVNNAVITSLLRLGLNLGGFALLTVRGRTSGKLIETPVALFAQGDARYLIAAYGEVNWAPQPARGGRQGDCDASTPP